MAEVKLDKVGKVYPGNVRAVAGVDLIIADGEFVVLVGPSGCGKSTTLRMIAGLEDITEGTIAIGPRVVNDLAPKDRDIAMVFQNYALYPHMTVFDNMAFGLKLRKFKKEEIRSRVLSAAKLLAIEELLERKPKALSGGQRQRVAVGRAIVREPAAFLFDEPLSNLDAKLRLETRAEIKRLHQRLKTTTVYVTHDQEEAMTLGDRIVIMNHGKVQQVDTPLAIYQNPKNLFVAGFLGTPPMNFIAGKLTSSGGQGLTFEGGGLTVPIPDAMAKRLADRRGQELVLGVRPEFFSLEPTPGAVPLDLRVEVVEPLGHVMDVYLSAPGGTEAAHSNSALGSAVRRHGTTDSPLIARVRSSSLSPGEVIKVHLEAAKVHLFEPGEHGQNLTLH